VLDPAIVAGTVVMQALERAGIRIGGGLKREAVPERSLLVLSHSSKPLREVLKGLGKYSNNFIAEQLVKVLGAERWGAPGSQKNGLAVLSDYLAGLGIPLGGFVLDNGSGLSKLTRLSSSQIIRVLLDLYGAPLREEFISILSIAGVDGTMHSKMRHPPLREKVFAKTGTLNGVQTLSGFYLNGEKKLAFSILLNELPISQNHASRVIETILKLVDS
jgi:D-alanyl-D-alanine carboxypeptidase/D-alanyl-D-alanine-endopeptidase (penicillin-binding protein 4)